MISQRSLRLKVRCVSLALIGSCGLSPAARAFEGPGNDALALIRVEGQPDATTIRPATDGKGTAEVQVKGFVIENASGRSESGASERGLARTTSGAVTISGESTPESPSGNEPTITTAQVPGDGKIRIESVLHLPALAQEVKREITFVMSLENELGLNLTPPDAAIRIHLELPEGQGLVVSGISASSPAARTGLRVNDIILNLDSEPLKDQGELLSKLKARAEKTAELKVLRGGKPITIKVRPRLKVQIDPVEDESTAFWIGVSVSEVDDLIKSQLGLPQGRGLIVNDVAKDSPGEKAGVKVNDILTEMAGIPLRDPQAMRNAVQSAAKNPVEVKLLRAGKPQTVTIEPVPHIGVIIQSGNPAVRKPLFSRPGGGIGGLGDNSPAAVPFRQLQLEQSNVFKGAGQTFRVEGAGQSFRLYGNPANGQFTRDPAAVVGQVMTTVPYADIARREDQGKLDQRLDDLSREIKELRDAIREMAKSEKK